MIYNSYCTDSLAYRIVVRLYYTRADLAISDAFGAADTRSRYRVIYVDARDRDWVRGL